jgi:putative MATE family efflux protein
MEKFARDMTKGNIKKELIIFLTPFLLANLIQAAYPLLASSFVGQYNGTHGLAVLSTASQIVLVIKCITIGISLGPTVLIAQYYGAKRTDEERKAIGTTFSLYSLIGLGITAVMLIIGGPMLKLFNTPAEVYDEALAYMNICMSGTLFIQLYNALSAVIRGRGDSKRPLWFVIIGLIFYVPLLYLFVGVMGMSATGAALALVITQFISAALCVAHILRGDFPFEFKLSNFKIHKDKARMLMKVGLPSALQQTAVQMSMTILLGIANGFGIVESAAMGVVLQINTFAVQPGQSMLGAVSAMAGQNIGVNDFERARRCVIEAAKVLTPVLLAVLFTEAFFSAQIISLFDNDPATIELGAKLLFLCFGDYMMFSYVFCINGLALGSGHAVFTMLNSSICSLAVRVPLAYLLTSIPGIGIYGVSLAICIAPVQALIVALIFFKGPWWRKNVVQTTAPCLE